jgi:hypothetical protein
MRKYILLTLALACILTPLLAQTDTLVVDNSPTEIPDWISYALNAALSALAVWLGKAKVRLNKAVTLLSTLAKVAEKGSVTSPEVRDVIDQAKDLVAKEKG